jgi:hypothetical protein
MAKVTKVKGLGKGTQLFGKTDNGDIGRQVEYMLGAHGHNLNYGQGPDLPDYKVEIKSRKKTATSSVNIGAMTTTDIINTPYEQTSVSTKLKDILFVEHDADFDSMTQVVRKSDMLDFNTPEIQKKIKSSYEEGRRKIASENHTKHVSCGDYGFFEKVENWDGYKFRIPKKGWDRLVNESRTMPQYNKLFGDN